ncbi:hypothetical protein BDV39DRAFT_20326 [Aspergillus sergii]|uniref:Uncharacterized protein n=1 Tax=Aspergillus sergii TaxID=1034303 RepID=A0A5N6WNT5_9EURO|nr:hypothetical protein BDV39DRAFT_20326 [Aspergillus sergii]
MISSLSVLCLSLLAALLAATISARSHWMNWTLVLPFPREPPIRRCHSSCARIYLSWLRAST